MSRKLYKYQFYNLDWTEAAYQQRSIKARSIYRKLARELKNKFKIETALYPEIDEAQKIITLRNEKRNAKRKNQTSRKSETIKKTEFDFEAISEQERFLQESIN